MKTNKEIIDSVTIMDFITLCQTVYGEARGEATEGRMAVIHTILNRVKKNTWYGKTASDVCLKNQQFSCWNVSDPNREKMENLTWDETENNGIFQDVKLALNWWKIGQDVTDNATHYHTGSVKPNWSRGKIACKVIGNHFFFNDVE